MSVTTFPLFATSISAANSSLNAGTTSGSFALSKTDRKEAWSLAMETQQSENWLRHGLTAHEYFIGSNSQGYQSTHGANPSFAEARSEKKVDSIDNSKLASARSNSLGTSGLQHPREGVHAAPDDGRAGVVSDDFGDQFFEARSETKITSLSNDFAEALNERINSSSELGTKTALRQDVSIGNTELLKQHLGQKTTQELSTDSAKIVAIGRSDLVSAEQFEGRVASDFFGTSNLDRVSMSTIDSRDLKNGLQSIEARLLNFDGNEENVEESSSDVKAKLALSEKNMASPSSQERMSFHTEISELGVRIWLGVNERTHGDVANLISHLRTWLMTQGVPLLSLVCNGKAIREVELSESGSEGRMEDARLKNSSAIEFPANIATDHYVKMAEELALIKF